MRFIIFISILVFFVSNCAFSKDFAQNSQQNREIKKLRKEIEQHNKNYFIFDKPTISDYEYDNLLQKLTELEKEEGKSYQIDSPSQKTGAQNPKTQKFSHKNQMYSLKKTYEKENLKIWLEKNISSYKNVTFCAEPKIDGLAVSLSYKNGVLTEGLTRGDGKFGENVLENLKMVETVPKTLKKPFNGEVRGEIYVRKDIFQNVSKKSSFAAERNYAAGSLRQKNPKITKERNLSFIAYQIISKNPPKTQTQALKELLELGFSANSCVLIKNFQEAKNYLDNFSKTADFNEIPTDGVVFKINELEYQEKSGYSLNAPKWALAYKFAPKTARTKLKSIEFSIGKTGVLTPVAHFSPVFIAGSKFEKANLHNLDEIKKLNLYQNDEITIKKAGEILPEVVSAHKTKNSRKILIPKDCPCCREKLIIENKNLKCKNPACSCVVSAKLAHFVSKDAMDIKGLGKNRIQSLVSAGVLSFSQIYSLGIEDLEKLEGIEKKSAFGLYFSIQNSKKPEFSKFLYALGINYTGEGTCQILARNFKNLDEIKRADIEDLNKIKSVGRKTAKSVFDYFHDEKNLEELEKLQSLGVI